MDLYATFIMQNHGGRDAHQVGCTDLQKHLTSRSGRPDLRQVPPPAGVGWSPPALPQEPRLVPPPQSSPSTCHPPVRI